jgi:hypothetical protein
MTPDERFLEIVALEVAELASDEHVSTPESLARIEPIFQGIQAKLAELKLAALARGDAGSTSTTL